MDCVHKNNIGKCKILTGKTRCDMCSFKIDQATFEKNIQRANNRINGLPYSWQYCWAGKYHQKKMPWKTKKEREIQYVRSRS